MYINITIVVENREGEEKVKLVVNGRYREWELGETVRIVGGTCWSFRVEEFGNFGQWLVRGVTKRSAGLNAISRDIQLASYYPWSRRCHTTNPPPTPTFCHPHSNSLNPSLTQFNFPTFNFFLPTCSTSFTASSQIFANSSLGLSVN